MSARNRRVAVFAVGLLGLPVVAYADLPIPPDVERRDYAERIGAKGFTCPEVISTDIPAADVTTEYGRRGLVPVVVSCSNGSKFLVAKPPRRYGAPVRDEPVVDPVVKRLN